MSLLVLDYLQKCAKSEACFTLINPKIFSPKITQAQVKEQLCSDIWVKIFFDPRRPLSSRKSLVNSPPPLSTPSPFPLPRTVFPHLRVAGNSMGPLPLCSVKTGNEKTQSATKTKSKKEKTAWAHSRYALFKQEMKRLSQWGQRQKDKKCKKKRKNTQDFAAVVNLQEAFI